MPYGPFPEEPHQPDLFWRGSDGVGILILDQVEDPPYNRARPGSLGRFLKVLEKEDPR